MKFDTNHLLKPQIDHTIRLVQSLMTNGIAWDASGTGQGKTYCACAAARHLKKRLVVICPKLSIPKWRQVLALFGLKADYIVNYEKLARGNMTQIYRYKKRGEINGVKVSAIPPFLCGEFRLPKDTLVILDESHRAKAVESLNAGLLWALKNQGYMTLCLSATQAMTPLDMRAFGYATNLHKGLSVMSGRGVNNGMNDFKKWAENAGAKFTGQWGAMYFDSNDPESVEKLQAVRHNLFETQKIAARMRREDFGNIFQHNQIECQAYDMGENGRKIRSVYHQMEAELAQLEDRCENYSQHIFAIITRARRLAELLKVPSLEELTVDRLDEGKSVLIFVNYQDTIDALVKRLTKTYGDNFVGQIHGQQTFKQRFADIDAFQADKLRVIVANLQAGGESIDLQDLTGKHPRASLINPSYRSISVVQAIGRPDRAHAKSDILTDLVMAAGTIEEQVADNFNRKKDHLDILNDGDLIPNGASFRHVAGMNV